MKYVKELLNLIQMLEALDVYVNPNIKTHLIKRDEEESLEALNRKVDRILERGLK